jgi:pimeloyl-ACP methyl ester carboxylesterase
VIHARFRDRRPRIGRHCAWRLAAASLAALLASGCVSLVHEITQPHTPDSASRKAADRLERNGLHLETQSMRARNGNRIAYRLLPAADYQLSYEYSRKPGKIDFSFAFRGDPSPVEARGTLVLLHGWAEDHRMMLPWALAMARNGYQGVLPDLRNFGASDRAPVGFGPREAEDIVDLLRALQAQGKLLRPVYLFGVSYGADVAIHAAAMAPGLVDGVVAMEPFVDAESAIRGFVADARKPAHGIKGRLFSAYARHALDDAHVDAAIAESGKRLGIDLHDTGIAVPLREGRACTLLLQGGEDEFFDPDALRDLSNSSQTRYVEMPDETHITLPLRIDLLADPLAQWLPQSAECPAFALPAKENREP